MSSELKNVGLVELQLVFPKELATIHNLPVAQVEQIERHQRRLGVNRENIDVVALGRSHLLPLFDLFDGGDQVAQSGRLLEAHLLAGRLHANAHVARQVRVPAFQEEADVAHRRRVRLIGGQSLYARPQAAVNVKLQAGLGVKSGEVHLARWHQEVPVDEVHQAVRQVGREVRTEIGRAVLPQPSRHVNPGILFVSQLDVRVRFVVAQQDVEARLVLLNQVVFESERFLLVINQNVVDIARFADQRSGLDIGQLVLGKVAAHPVSQALRLADVDHPAAGVLVQIHSGREGELAYLVTEFHRRTL